MGKGLKVYLAALTQNVQINGLESPIILVTAIPVTVLYECSLIALIRI